jgi:hypothetical protein
MLAFTLGLLSVVATPALDREAPCREIPDVPRAAPDEDAETPRTAIRANAVVEGFDFTGFGVEASHSFDGHFALEASLDRVDLDRGNTGLFADVLVRFGYFGPRHALDIAFGPGLLDASKFGRVAFFVPEVAYEYRRQGGVSVAVGAGLPTALNDSPDVPCISGEISGCFLVRTQFHKGDTMPRLRVALGYSF